jgi:hypothetical protein
MRSTRHKLYPAVGYLYPAGTARLADVTDENNIEYALSAVPEYQKLYASLAGLKVLVTSPSFPPSLSPSLIPSLLLRRDDAAPDAAGFYEKCV